MSDDKPERRMMPVDGPFGPMDVPEGATYDEVMDTALDQFFASMGAKVVRMTRDELVQQDLFNKGTPTYE